jgi:hypothetical protein
MRAMTLSASTVLTGAVFALLAGCASAEAPAAKAGSVPANVAALQNQIRDEIGDPVCTADSQCRTVAVGHKACGGPEAYKVWSTQVSNGPRLLALAEAHRQARREEAAQSGRVSDCSMVVDPGARCDSGRCVPAGRGPAVM